MLNFQNEFEFWIESNKYAQLETSDIIEFTEEIYSSMFDKGIIKKDAFYDPVYEKFKRKQSERIERIDKEKA